MGLIISYIMIARDRLIVLTPQLLMLVGVSMILSYIDTKFTCLSYGVAFLYFLKLFLIFLRIPVGWFVLPFPILIQIVGVLHVGEGIMIRFYGYRNIDKALTYQDKKLLGGYTMKRRWILPLFFIQYKNILLPLVAVLIYSDYTFSISPRKKAKIMGNFIMIYGLTIYLLGEMVYKQIFPILFAMIIMPIGHEILFSLDKSQ